MPEIQVSIKDLVMFTLKYRKFKAFIDWSIPDIIKCFLIYSSAGTLCYCADEEGITGVMVGEVRESRFYIINILSIKRNMPHFIAYILNNFPQCTHIATNRHGRMYKEYAITQSNFVRFMKGTQ